MHSPALHLATWWTIAIGGTIIFYAFFLPLLPTRQLQLRLVLGPILPIAGQLLNTVYLRGDTAAEVLPLFSCAILTPPLALLGRREQLRQLILEHVAQGSRRGSVEMPKGMKIQMFATVAVMAALGVWFAQSA